jgi:hypothetical protein
MKEIKDIQILAQRATSTTDLNKLERLLAQLEVLIKSARVRVRILKKGSA